MPQPLHLETFGPIHALPILHYRMEFASLVRLAVEQLQPDCIAVELPRTLEAPVMRGVERLPQVSVVSYEPGGKQTVYLLIEPADPLVEGLRLAREKNIAVAFVDADVDDYPANDDPIPDPYAVRRIGLGPYYREFEKATNHTLPNTADARREQAMAHRLQSLAENHQRILFICGMAHVARIAELFQLPQPPPLERVRRENVRLFHLHPDSCREVLGEFGFVSAIYEWSRGELPPEPPAPPSLRKRFDVFELISGGKQEVREEEALEASILRSSRLLSGPLGPDRQRILYRLFEETARHYKQETGEPVHLWQKRAFFRFSRNCALVEHRLLPDFFELLAAARGCIDENFAYAFWRLATFYPFQKSSTELPTIRLRPEDLGALRRLRFRPRPRREEKKLSSLKFLNRKREKRPGEWLEGFDSPAICSYPPEDLVIEDYGDFLKKKGAKQLSEEESRVEPLTSSLLDGIDLRETVRNIVADGRIYVREHQRVKGGVGGVVVIFDEDRGTKKYPYQMTWLGEHEQESDMAFYATLPTDNVVGPGICRCEYGGFLLSYPPRRMAEVWTDPDYVGTRGKHEVLLLAALDYSREKHIVYVAPKPPRSIFRQFAARIGKKIVYIPLGSLSPVKLKKIRILHILYGHDKRETARDYIW